MAAILDEKLQENVTFIWNLWQVGQAPAIELSQHLNISLDGFSEESSFQAYLVPQGWGSVERGRV